MSSRMRIRSRTLVTAALIIGLLSLIVFPIRYLFVDGFPVTDDGEWMIIRLSAFYQSLAEGQFPVRYLGRLNDGYGYPVANFLYPGYLYLGSVLRILGMSFVDAVKMIFIISVGLIVLGTYGWLRKERGRFAGFVGACSAALSPYLLFDIYKRGSIGEVLAIAMGILNLWAVSAGNGIALAVVFAALLVSHNTVALLYAPLIAAYVIYRRSYGMIGYLFLGAGAAAFFWMPALLELRYIVFGDTPVSDPMHYMGRETISLILFPTVIAGLGVMVLSRKKQKRHSIAPVVLYALVLFFSTSASMPLWNSILGAVVQFPFRFLSLAIPLGAYVTAQFMGFFRPPAYHILGTALVISVTVNSLYAAGPVRFENKPDSYYTTNESTTTVADEYMPIWVTEPIKGHPFQVIDVIAGDADVIVTDLKTQEISAVVEASVESIIEINKIYYPGWGVAVDGIPTKIDIADKTGQMRFSVAPGIHRIHAEFHDTPERFVADLISAASILIIVVMSLRWISRTRRTA